MIKLYNAPVSGNSHKVRMLLSFLKIDHEVVPVNLPRGEQKLPQHLARHPLGKVPVIEDGDVTVWDSQAILVYLAQKYDPARTWYPTDVPTQALIQSWLSFAVHEMTEGPTMARAAIKFKRDFIDLDAAQAKSKAAFGVLDNWLENREWLAGDGPTIADVAVYPYAGLAWEGGLDTDAFQNMAAWLKQIEGLPDYVGMENLPKP